MKVYLEKDRVKLLGTVTHVAENGCYIKLDGDDEGQPFTPKMLAHVMPARSTWGQNSLQVGPYEISKMHEGPGFWISKEGGEGMEVGMVKLAALLEKFWNEEF